MMQAMLTGSQQRLHLHHGPIDLIIEAETGANLAARQHLFHAAAQAASPVLDRLAADLERLRAPYKASRRFADPVARRMQQAVQIAAPDFITPMAAVAGAVADHVLAAMLASPAARFARKIWVNNGGDIAFWADQTSQVTAMLAGLPGARICLPAGSRWSGIATSGQGGRSQSLGIADQVTVLASHAALADAAATLIANHVDLPGHPSISRCPAAELFPDSDLGDRPVVVGVGQLTKSEALSALDAGIAEAQRLMQAAPGIAGAVLCLGGQTRLAGLAPDILQIGTASRQSNQQRELCHA